MQRCAVHGSTIPQSSSTIVRTISKTASYLTVTMEPSFCIVGI